MIKQIRTALGVCALTVAAFATAQQAAVELANGHPDTYTVRKGDTLWDISAKFLKKPWLWPEIWQANPQVQNPHLIYPGDVLSLAYLDRVQVTATQPAPPSEPPLTGVPLADVEPFLKDLRIVNDNFKQLPYVVGLEDNRLRGSGGQAVYIKGQAAQVGQRYAVVRPTAIYARPKLETDLDARGDHILGEGSLWKNFEVPDKKSELLGYELARVGIGTVTRAAGNGVDTSTLVLEDNGKEVRAGDRIVPLEAQRYDLQFFPHPPAHVPQPNELRVLAVADNLSAGGPRDVIAISGGRREGIDNGTVFSIWRQGSHVKDLISGPKSDSRMDDAFTGSAGRATLPDEYAAHAMVFRTYDKVSYALVMEGTKPVQVGYELKHPDATK